MINIPLVTVIIPTFNRANYIRRSINSVKNQTYKNIELIVVDDGSTDNTLEIVNEFKDIIYIYKPNGRQASARNLGLNSANGDYVATLDSDDYWYPNFIEESIAQFTNFDFDFDFVFANKIVEDENGNKREVFSKSDWCSKYYNSKEFLDKTWVNLSGKDARDIFTKTCPAPSSALLFKKSSISHKWDEKLDVADDWDFILALLVSKECHIAFCKKPLWRKYIVGDNIYESLTSEAKTKTVIFKDLNYILTKNSAKYSKSEKSNIQNLQITAIVPLSINNLVNFNLKEFANLFTTSLKINSSLTIKRLTTLLYIKILKRLTRVYNK